MANKVMKNILTGARITVAISALLSSQAFAQSLPAPGQAENGWRHSVAVYMFAPLQTTGTSAVNGVSVPVDLSLKEILEYLDFSASGRYEAWNGDFGAIVDANYAGLKEDTVLPGPAATPVNISVRQKWLGLLAAYRLADGTYGAAGQRYTLDVQAGARYNSIRQEITVGNTLVGATQDWWEPVVGARAMWRLNDRWTSHASLDLGGFGVGGNDLQIGANLGFDYQPWDKTALMFGYRYFSVDYSSTLASGPFIYDSKQHGPYMGVKYNF